MEGIIEEKFLTDDRYKEDRENPEEIEIIEEIMEEEIVFNIEELTRVFK